MEQPKLRPGLIIRARVPDAEGRNDKSRPLVIVDCDEEPGPDDLINVVAITTSVAQAPPQFSVELPWHRSRHPRTGLNQRCVAVCDWIIRIKFDAIEQRVGIVPDKQLLAILKLVETIISPGEDTEAPPEE